MARARNIKPSFFQNEELGELHPLERLAFIGMWTIADFKGCIEFRPKRLKVQLLPYDECDFEVITNNLEQSGFISTYSVSGQRYIKIINFEKHQNPHKNERESGSNIPDIDFEDKKPNENNGLDKFGNNPELNGTAPADSLNPLPDSLNADSLIPDSPTGDAAPKNQLEKTDQQERISCVLKAVKDFYAEHNKIPVGLSSTHPKFILAIEAGATPQEFVDASAKAMEMGKEFSFTCGMVFNRRKELAELSKTELHKGALKNPHQKKADERQAYNAEVNAKLAAKYGAGQEHEVRDAN
jgi:hypothetical protein